MRARALLAAGIIVATLVGCRHHGTRVTDTDGAVKADSISGIVSVTGTSFEQHIVLRTGSSVRALATSNAGDSIALTGLGGVELTAYGIAHTDRFELSQFVVRSVDGARVADGVLIRDGTRYSLRTRTGDLPLGNPPSAFESLVGARLWVGGPIDTGPNVYGVIQPATK